MTILFSVSFPQVSSSDCTVEDIEFDPDLINCDVLVGHLPKSLLSSCSSVDAALQELAFCISGF